MDDFSISWELNGNVVVVTLSGRVDSVTAAKLDAELLKIVNENKKIVMDLKDVVYMSSAGVRAIARALQSVQKSEGGVKLVGIRKPVVRVLQTIGLTEVLKSYPSVEEAVASF
jgi:anti-sigma B factor antagonist